MERRRNSTETGTTTTSPTRPDSTWTDETNFTDPAVGMDAISNPPRKDNAPESEMFSPSQSLSPISQSLADRMRRWAAAAWALEQDDEMSDLMRQRIEDKLRGLELIIEGDALSDTDAIQDNSMPEHNSQPRTPAEEQPLVQEKDEWLDRNDLHQVHNNLADVLGAMRLRQHEQRHLHQLTATKLEAIAQKCLFQEQQMQDLVIEVQNLRLENQALGQENDGLRETMAELETEASKRELAVSAMTSAVAGLEGWIDDVDTSQADATTATPPPGSRPRRAVIRGKGRFRGRYYVDDQGHYFTGSPDARELQDGVKAWIRGFRDVEDACSSPVVEPHPKEPYRRPIHPAEDDWGEFESPAASVL